MEKKKKGMIVTTTLVTVILLVLGFLIVLFLYYQLNGTGRVDREVCHQSVIYRATLPSFAGVRGYVPLKCKTQKVCITTGFIGGECEEFKNVKGVLKVKVKKGEEGKKQIEKFIAQDMVECWSAMGEGKVAVFGNWLAEYGIGKVGSSCVICSRIAFDKENLEKVRIEVDDIDVLQYMMTHAIPNGEISYYDYLTKEGGKASFNFDKEIEIVDLKDVEIKDGEVVDKEGEEKFKFTLNSPAEASGSINEMGIMFMQVSAPRNSRVFRNNLQALVGGFGASFVLAPHITLSTITNIYAWALIAVVGGYEQLNTLNNRAVAAGSCGDISVGTEARDGCSVVRMIDYDKEDLSKYCSIVESIP